MYTETIEHIFYECFIIRNFWFSVIELWNNQMNKPIVLSCRNIILGYNVENVAEHITENIFILYVKKYIYNCKMSENPPTVTHFINFLSSSLRIIQVVNSPFKVEYEKLKNFATANV